MNPTSRILSHPGPTARLAALAAGLVLFAAVATARAADLADLIDLHRAVAGVAAVPGSLATPGLRLAATGTPPAPATEACPALLRHDFTRLQGGAPQSLCQFSGKVLLVVNTASYCGFTRQYEGLEALYRKYRDRGLVVLGFPSNDFLQEPGSNRDVEAFCRTTYGVEFPMFEKGTVTRLASNPFYAELARRTGEAPKWNFHKYLVDRDGRTVTSFGSSVEPDRKDVVELIEKLLAAKPPAGAA